MIRRSHRDTLYEQACTPTLKTNQLVFLYNNTNLQRTDYVHKQTTETNVLTRPTQTRQTRDLIRESSTQTCRTKETTRV